MKNFNRVFGAALFASVSALGMTSQAFAQAADEANSGGLDEIIVTAQKRGENLQQTPLAISAISSEQLDLQQIAEAKDLGALAPNVSVVGATTTTRVEQAVHGPALWIEGEAVGVERLVGEAVAEVVAGALEDREGEALELGDGGGQTIGEVGGEVVEGAGLEVADPQVDLEVGDAEAAAGEELAAAGLEPALDAIEVLAERAVGELVLERLA